MQDRPYPSRYPAAVPAIPSPAIPDTTAPNCAAEHSFGRGLSIHLDDRVAAQNGGSARVLLELLADGLGLP
jgi:hypothetical protein